MPVVCEQQPILTTLSLSLSFSYILSSDPFSVLYRDKADMNEKDNKVRDLYSMFRCSEMRISS
jgi:hypothetical protein